MRLPVALLRMSKWARRPPSDERVKMVLGIIAVCLVLAGIERFIGWPDFLTTEKTGLGPTGR